jgi:colanic acid/amylovoran biosynthesis protein
LDPKLKLIQEYLPLRRKWRCNVHGRMTGAGRRFTKKWWLAQANKRTGLLTHSHLLDLEGRHDGIAAALELGGDNYSLDYGRPTSFMSVDRFLISKDLPVVLWGASVGPFDKDPDFAISMLQHLKNLDGIYVRETTSFEYLRNHGVSENVHLVADPAFLMSPAIPSPEKIGFEIPAGSIGINLSPLVARYRGESTLESALSEWTEMCVALISAVARKFERPIILVPHVESSSPENDDFRFLEGVAAIARKQSNLPIYVVSKRHCAAELKWIISQCSVFAGARTHSTIAALSSCVPTLSFGYSIKATGINRDIFGHTDYCMPVASVRVAEFVEKLAYLMDHQETIRGLLEARLPAMKSTALNAGALLASLLH